MTSLVNKLSARLDYKLWFLFDLPTFIKENQLKNGLELGAKAGRSMFWMLLKNKRLHLTGIDKWEILNSKAYKSNNRNESICKQKLKPFNGRVVLHKGDANAIAKQIKNDYFDFIHFDLISPLTSSAEDVKTIIKHYLPKLKNNGFLIARDLHKTPYFEALQEEFGITMTPCIIKGKVSKRLHIYKKV